MIDEPRAQNPYQLYTDTRRRSSLYDFSLADDHQRKQPTSFIQGGSFSSPISTLKFVFNEIYLCFRKSK